MPLGLIGRQVLHELPVVALDIEEVNAFAKRMSIGHRRFLITRGQHPRAQGFDIIGNTPEEFAAQVKAELAKWARVAANAAITPE